MSLKNLVREQTTRNGMSIWRLRTLQGEEVEAFTRFGEFAQRYRPNTTKRYLEVVGRFLDYLYEAGVFDGEPHKRRRLNAIIDAYPLLLRDGSELTARRVLENHSSGIDDMWLASTASALAWTPLRPDSFQNTIAAVNHFLALSDMLGQEEIERASLVGLEHHGGYEGLIEALRGQVALGHEEVYRMRQNSLLGSVAKYVGKGLRRPRGLKVASPISRDALFEKKAFPMKLLHSLVEAASCWRDKALWLLLAASGIRTSEARNLWLDDIFPEEQKLYIFDPRSRRMTPGKQLTDVVRFKGRTVAATYLFPPLRQHFFQALEQYLKLEFIPMASPGEPTYLFQYVEPARRGRPFVNASDTTLVKSFKTASRKAGVPLRFDGKEYAPHSLRHLYGDYMLNDFPLDPVNGRFGLPITDVQMLMGHAKLTSTRKYARASYERLTKKLEDADEALFQLQPEEKPLLQTSALHERLSN